MIRPATIESRFFLFTTIGLLIGLLSACASPTSGDISLLPMYGGVEKTEKQKQADEYYLKRADAHYDNRRVASEKAAKAGWNYLYRGDWQTAMRRFNQSWLLDQENYDTYWGFLVILAAQGKYRESNDMGDIALSLAPDNHKLMCDVAFSYGSYANTIKMNLKEKERYFQKALSLCEKATAISPNYPCQAWAVTLFFSGQYLEAWKKVKRAEDLGHRYPQAFLTDLGKKLPRPESL